MMSGRGQVFTSSMGVQNRDEPFCEQACRRRQAARRGRTGGMALVSPGFWINTARMWFRFLPPGVVLLVWVFSGQAAEVFPLNAEWKFFKGLAEASSPDRAAWRQIGFDDTAWLTAPAPFWYGDVQPAPGTRLDDMRGNYTCVFLRKEFVVSNPADVSELRLDALSDDGFIAWINGREIARFNVPDGEIPFDGTALPALSEPIPMQSHTISSPAEFLVAGGNVLAVQALNTSLSGSSDFVFNASLSSAVDVAPPTVLTLIPPAGARVQELTSIEVQFSEGVRGVEAADLLINGAPATVLSVFDAAQYVFEFPAPPAGTVEVAWRADHGITDLAGAANPFGGGSWRYTVDPDALPPGVVISEFMADNDDTIRDEDGDDSDWIELHNAGAEAANLGGWFLTDDPTNLAKWRLPNVTLLPDTYLLIFASEKNRTNPAARLHTNFKLEADGEYLALVDREGRVVSEFAPVYPPQRRDVSYGRERSAPDVVGYFVAPTPGGPNSTSGPDFAPAVDFSRPGGTFSSAFTLALSTGHPAATIRYTLDGSLPTAASPAYAQPLAISTTVQVRARAFVDGLLPGPPRSETYLQLNPNVLNFTSDLPLMVIHNFGQGTVPANVDQFASLAVFEPKAGVSSLTNVADFRARTGINIRGSSTQGLPKKSYAVEFWDEFDSDLDLSILGLPAEADWVLYAPNNFEPVLIHNPLMFQLSNDIGSYAPRTRFVELYVNTGGGPVSQANYVGIYVLMEKIKRGPDRVDVPNLQPEHSQPPQVTGGYVLKIDRLDPGDSGFFAAGQQIAYVDPKEEEIEVPQRSPQRTYIRDYLNAFGNALNSPNFTDPLAGYRAFVDVPSWIDHHLLNVLAFNVDALRLSAYFYKQREGKLFFGPIWDFDRSLNSTDGRDANPRVWRAPTGDRGTDFFNYPWWGRMFRDPDFWQAYIDRYQELRTAQFSTNHLFALIDQLVAQVRAAQPREQARWSGSWRPRGSYENEVNILKSWLAQRVHFMDTNFLARPTLGAPGGPIAAGFQLTLSGPPGATLYYTLDGTDPRQSGGAVAPGARLYSGPLTLRDNARVVARAFDANHRNLTGANNPPISSSWSGPVAATYVVSTPPLVITEIMYHPAPPPAGDTNEPSAFEYLELKNVGTAPLNLVGTRLSGGVEFTFAADSAVTSLAPGATVLVVKNRAAFATRYPGVGNVAGEFTGQLDNTGERLVLEGPLREPILDFRYEDEWYPITDGPGFSLVVVNEQAAPSAWGDPRNWRPSASAGGSPGGDDPPPPVLPPVLVNEVLTHTDPPALDAVELHNPNAAAVEVSGWFLTDDFRTPEKFRLPAGTVIPSGGYVIFDERDFNTGAAGSFSFSSLGEEVFLFSAAGDALTGYVHGFRFGASANGVSFGRYVTSVGQEHFVAQRAASLGGPNAGPLVGPVVINEIMYHPPAIVGTNNNTLDEFIELRNVSGQTVPLFDPNAPTNTWRLEGAVEFSFPPGLELGPDGYVLVVGFDPVFDLFSLNQLRAYYGLGPGVVVLGPYAGRLDNAGDRLRLSRPDPPQAAPNPRPGFVPYVLVDEVAYAPESPWPAEADGTGFSLQRRVSTAYGNDPVNWMAASPTPAAPNPDSAGLDGDGDGLPDDWEIAHGLDPERADGADGAEGDPDGDGFTNKQEYLSGTDPRSAASFLHVEAITVAGPTTVLRFTAVAGRSYSVLYRDELNEGAWSKLTDVSAPAMTQPIEVADEAAPRTGRFYRLVTPAAP